MARERAEYEENGKSEEQPVSKFVRVGKIFAYSTFGFLALVILFVVIGGNNESKEEKALVATEPSKDKPKIKMEAFFGDLQATVYGTGMLALDGETGPKEERARYADFDLESCEETSMYMALTWKDTPDGMAEVRGATEGVARIAVQKLAKTGKDLSNFTLSVRSQMRVKGLTGKNLLTGWGRAKYDCFTDSLVWIPFGE
jgi:hypothetical protein